MTTRRTVLASVIAATMLPLAAARAVWADSWVDLGSRRVKATVEADRIMVADNTGLYTKLRISVAGNGVFVDRATVLFGNGEEGHYTFETFIERGSVSGALDLPGGGRAIVHVDMVYRRRKNGGPAVVTLQGLSS